MCAVLLLDVMYTQGAQLIKFSTLGRSSCTYSMTCTMYNMRILRDEAVRLTSLTNTLRYICETTVRVYDASILTWFATMKSNNFAVKLLQKSVVDEFIGEGKGFIDSVAKSVHMN